MGRKQQPKKSHKQRPRPRKQLHPRRQLDIDPEEARKLLGNRTRTQDTEVQEEVQEIIFDLPRPQHLTPEEEKQLCAKCGHERAAHHTQECVGGWQRDRTDWPRCQCTTYLFEAKQPEVKT